VLNLDDAFGYELVQQYQNGASLHGLTGSKVLAYSIDHAALPARADAVSPAVSAPVSTPVAEGNAKNTPEISLVHASHLRTHHAGTSFHVDSAFGSGTVKPR